MTPERLQKLRCVLTQRQPDLTVVTDYVHKGRNLSAIVRNCDAVGIGRMHAVVPEHEYRAFRGTAKGSHDWVDVIRHDNLEDAVGPLKRAGMQIVAAHLSDSARDYRNVDYTKPTALLMGAERTGLSAVGQSIADHHVIIPMRGMVESFNVSVAAGVILAEARWQREKAGMYEVSRLPADEYDKTFFEWAHPQVVVFCRQHGLAYPALREDGEIDEPAAWYADVRKQLSANVAGE